MGRVEGEGRERVEGREIGQRGGGGGHRKRWGQAEVRPRGAGWDRREVLGGQRTALRLPALLLPALPPLLLPTDFIYFT